MSREQATKGAALIMSRRLTTDPVAWAVQDTLTGEWAIHWTRQSTGETRTITGETFAELANLATAVVGGPAQDREALSALFRRAQEIEAEVHALL